MAILYVNLFTAYLGIGLIIPIMPALMDELRLSGTTVGMLVATFAIFQFLCSPMAGRAADRWGRKWFIVAGLLLYAASQFMFGAAAQVWLLFVARALGGVSAAMIMPAVTAFQDSRQPPRRRQRDGFHVHGFRSHDGPDRRWPAF